METFLVRKINRCGNSFHLALPVEILTACNFRRLDHVIFYAVVDGGFAVRVISDAEIRNFKERNF